MARPISIVDEFTYDDDLGKQDKYKRRKIQEGLCPNCGQPRDYMVTIKPKVGVPYTKLAQRCKKCSDAINERRRERYMENK